jgi:hypothetical protein
MKQYLLSVYHPDGGGLPPDEYKGGQSNVDAVVEEAKAAGAWVFGGVLHPSTTATVVRDQAGEQLITDGPFVEGKEHIAGFWIIRAPDLDAAVEWAHKTTRAGHLPIEVRPFQIADEG